MSAAHAYRYHAPKVPHRELILHLAPPGAAVTLPDAVDQRSNAPPVVDQGQEGSCTGESGTGCAGILSAKQIRDGAWTGPQLIASAQALYWAERAIDGTTDQDAGASIADSVHAAANTGYLADATWPYSSDMYTAPPAGPIVAKLADYAPLAYDWDTICAALASAFPLQVGVNVYSSFESDTVTATGIVPLPDPTSEQLEGGHALCILGYDRVARTVIGRNSWGTSWGMQGYFTMPADYLLDPSLCMEIWALRRLAQS